jgi:hypothetical protein
MSSSTDGKILIWDDQLRFPSRGYMLVRKKNQEIGVVGTLSCTQSFDDKNMIVIGTEGGSVFKMMILSMEKPFQASRWNQDACAIMSKAN